ncbi:MAG: SH3 domain-containing protein [Thermomicrobium sp.]|nr:SH3 domain-containing protein [Thermomicrobium sp.]
MGKTRLPARLVSACLALLAAAVLLTPALAANDLVTGTLGQVAGTNGDGVNVRSAPGRDAERVGGLPEGARVTILEGPQSASDGSLWYKVQAPGLEGWVLADYLAAAVPAAGDTVRVTGTAGYGLRLRAAPSADAAVLAIMPEGGHAQVTGAPVTDGSGTEWVPLRYEGNDGFAARAYLAVVAGDSGSATSQPVAQTRQITNTPTIQVGGNAEVVNTDGQGVNVRYGAGYDQPIAAVAPEGTVMRVIGGPQTDGQGITWWQVDYRGIQGWVHGGYLAPTDRAPEAAAAVPAESTAEQSSAAPAPSSVGDRIVATAMQYLGRPYVWGGTTPAGFDCSGFVYFVVNQVLGGGFPRSLEAQAVAGVSVDPDHLQPGDLVFFQNTYKWGLSHVGIYIGNGRFIHAENYATGVTISELWGDYYGPRYYTARRVGS